MRYTLPKKNVVSIFFTVFTPRLNLQRLIFWQLGCKCAHTWANCKMVSTSLSCCSGQGLGNHWLLLAELVWIFLLEQSSFQVNSDQQIVSASIKKDVWLGWEHKVFMSTEPVLYYTTSSCPLQHHQPPLHPSWTVSKHCLSTTNQQNDF